MAKERIVNVRFWRDNYVVSLKPDARLLFLWAITNPATELCGAYETPMGTIEAETGLKAKRIREIFDLFEADGKIIYKDGWVIVANFAKHQHATSTSIKAGIQRTLNDCPNWVKDTVSRGYTHGVIYLDLDSVRQPKPRPNGRGDAPPAADAGKKSTKKGTRLPDRFFLTSEMREWARVKRPDVDLTIETEKFCNHFRSAPGQKGVKLDWLLTWKNWILNARGVNGNGANKPNGTGHRATSVERLRATADIASEYPTEAELRRQP